jgi:hypothetical protein
MTKNCCKHATERENDWRPLHERIICQTVAKIQRMRRRKQKISREGGNKQAKRLKETTQAGPWGFHALCAKVSRRWVDSYSANSIGKYYPRILWGFHVFAQAACCFPSSLYLYTALGHLLGCGRKESWIKERVTKLAKFF